MSKFVPEQLRKAAEIYEQRNLLYGDSYKSFGKLMKVLFPDGIMVKYEEDWNRLSVLMMAAGKLHRYAPNFAQGGHEDSLTDLSVYAQMLNELDEDFKAAGKTEPAQVLKSAPKPSGYGDVVNGQNYNAGDIEIFGYGGTG